MKFRILAVLLLSPMMTPLSAHADTMVERHYVVEEYPWPNRYYEHRDYDNWRYWEAHRRMHDRDWNDDHEHVEREVHEHWEH